MLKRSNEIKKYNEYKKSKPVQLELFSLSNIFEDKREKYSSTAELYDLVPKYYHGDITKIRTKDGLLKIIKREFEFRKQKMTLSISPALLLQKDGETKAFFPSQKEEIIEDVLRKFATDPKRNDFLDDRLAVRFTLYELWKELKSIKHTFSYEEIRESLEILSKTNIEIKSKDNKIAFSSNMFETLGRIDENEGNIDNRIEEYSKKIIYFVRFNSLVSESIKNKTWRIINYKQLMNYKKVISRWLHRKISHMFVLGTVEIPYVIMLSTIIKNSGMKKYNLISGNIRHIKECLDEMVMLGSLSKYDMQKIFSKEKKNKIEDVKFSIYISESFFDDIQLGFLALREKDNIKQIENNNTRETNKDLFKDISKKTNEEKDYIKELKEKIVNILKNNKIKFNKTDLVNLKFKTTNEEQILVNIKAAVDYINKQTIEGNNYSTIALLKKAIDDNWQPNKIKKEENNLSIEDKEKIVNDKIEKFISEQTDNNNIKLIFKNILKNFGRSIFAGWFMYMKYVELKEDILVFSVENKFVKDTIIKDYLNGAKKEIDGKTTWLRKGIEQVCKDTSPNIKQVKIISVKKQYNNKT